MTINGRGVGFFELLNTASSEVLRQNLFNKERNMYVPDLFVTIFFMSLFCFSVSLDLVLLFYLIFNKKVLVIIVFAATMIPHSICEFFLEKKKARECLAGYVPNPIFYIGFYLLGFGSIFTTVRVLRETFTAPAVPPVGGFSLPFFHISNENLSIIRIYCCINVVLKSIPQLLIASIFILDRHVTGGPAYMLGANIGINVVIFSQAIATTFPLRRAPRVFTTSSCILLNALNKFMATVCACCVHLTVFAAMFKSHKYYAVLVVVLRSVIWVFPCWQGLSSQPLPISKLTFAVYFSLFTLVFGFIYVHPFGGLGKPYYHIFYFLGFLLEIFLLYLVSDADLQSVTYYLAFKLLMIGFLSTFALVNILQKFTYKKLMLFFRVDPRGRDKTGEREHKKHNKGSKSLKDKQKEPEPEDKEKETQPENEQSEAESESKRNTVKFEDEESKAEVENNSKEKKKQTRRQNLNFQTVN